MQMETILALIYPRVCGFCGKLNNNYLCEDCEKEIQKELIFKIEEIHDKYFEKHIYLAEYAGLIRQYILSYKFHENSYMYKTFAKIILKNKKICGILTSYDIIIPVPIHKKRKAVRGYNQSDLIAREISHELKIKRKNVLIKIKNNIEQSSLNSNERIENVKNAYKIVEQEIINNKKIILLDDVYTTGNTTNECSKILKENGAKEILVLTIAG